MGFKLNLTNQEIKAAQGGFPVLDEGVYGAKIFSATESKSKAGNDMYVIDYKIIDGPKAAMGRKQRAWYVITSNALFGIIGLNKAVGFPYPTKDTPEGEFEFADAEDYLGKNVNINIVQEDYESVDEETGEDVVKQRNNIKRVTPYDPEKVLGSSVVSADSGLFL